mmetsp:Transcript_13047/g.17970  ORF Transcript_13047/g.17970 Transcript_13047/m.17970 type:complete len:226 (-) Transcript_13047:3-680(-)
MLLKIFSALKRMKHLTGIFSQQFNQFCRLFGTIMNTASIDDLVEFIRALFRSGVISDSNRELFRFLVIHHAANRVIKLHIIKGAIDAVTGDEIFQNILPRQEAWCILFEMVIKGVVVELHELLWCARPQIVVHYRYVLRFLAFFIIIWYISPDPSRRSCTFVTSNIWKVTSPCLLALIQSMQKHHPCGTTSDKGHIERWSIFSDSFGTLLLALEHGQTLRNLMDT